MKKLITIVLLCVLTTSFAQLESKAEIRKIIKEQSDGIITPAQKGVSTVYTDGKSTIQTVYSDLKSTAPQIAKGVNEMAKGLKVGAESVWKVLVKQQLVWSIAFLILTITSIINWCIFYKRNVIKIKIGESIIGQRGVIKQIPNPDFDQEYYNTYKKYLNSGYSSERGYTEKVQFKKTLPMTVKEDYLMAPPEQNKSDGGLFKYIHFVVCIVLSGLSFYHFSDMLTGFINPEFGAMKNIVELTLSLKQ